MPDEPRRLPTLLLRQSLRACGSDRPDEAVADLQEEMAARRAGGAGPLANGLWWTWQVGALCGWALLDRRGGAWRDGRRGLRLASRGAALGDGRGECGPVSSSPRGPDRTGERVPGARACRWHPVLALTLALRSFRAAPGPPVAAAMTLALGFGAAAAILGVFVGFGRDLPVPGGDRVVQVRVAEPSGTRSTVSAAELRLLRARATTLAGLGGFRTFAAVVAAAELPPVRVPAASLTPGVLETLAVAPVRGALPDAAGASGGVVILGHELWTRRFAADPGVVGSSLRVDGVPRTVAAVMPEGFGFPYRQDLWVVEELPVGAGGAGGGPAGGGYELVGRLADGVSPGRAADDLDVLLGTLPGAEPEEIRVQVLGFTEQRGEGGELVALAALLILVVALVMVSCTNVSNLLLGRALARARSLSVHAALGATPVQVATQMLAEALLIALAGGLLGLALAQGALSYIETTLSGHWGYHWMRVGMGTPVVAFTALLAVLTALVAGGLPAARAARTDLTRPLKAQASGQAAGPGRVTALLLGGQVVFSSVALVVAVLMATALLGTLQVGEGFPAEEVQVASLQLDDTGGAGGAAGAPDELRRSLLAAIEGRPEVRHVGLTTGLPGLDARIATVEVDGRTPDPGEAPRRTPTVGVTPGFFDVFEVRLLRGRLPGAADSRDTEPVAVVSARFAEAHFPGEDPLGRRVHLAYGAGDDVWARIVGVVADVVIYDSVREDAREKVYRPLAQMASGSFHIVYRAAGSRPAAADAVRTALRSVAPDLPLGEGLFGDESVATMADVLAFVRRLFETAGALAVLGSVAAALVAVLGLHGVVAFEVGRRVSEIGVRMALGASRGEVLRAVLGRALLWVAPGLALGLGIAWLLGPLFGVFLLGAEARDPVIFGATALAYLGVAMVAASIPARRAARLDPARVLRRV